MIKKKHPVNFNDTLFEQVMTCLFSFGHAVGYLEMLTLALLPSNEFLHY